MYASNWLGQEMLLACPLVAFESANPFLMSVAHQIDTDLFVLFRA